MTHRSAYRVLLLGMATVAALAPAAHAGQGVDKATWDTGWARGSCSAGVNTRTCTYDVSLTNCQEASVATGGPQVLVPCNVTFHGSVTVQPRVNGAGQVIGCTSVVGTESGTVTFSSGLSGGFSNTIPVTTLTVQGAHPDQKTGVVVHFAGTRTNGLNNWAVNGTLSATCAPSNSSSGSITAGSVTVSSFLQ